jgi:hypothetical protein
MVEITICCEYPIRDYEMPVRMEAEVGGETVLAHKYAGFEDLLQFRLAMPVHRGLSHHLTTENSDDDLGDLAKELGVLKNPET